MYDEYLTRSNNCVSIWSSLPNAKERQNLEQQIFENGLTETVALCNVGATLIHTSLHIFRFIIWILFMIPFANAPTLPIASCFVHHLNHCRSSVAPNTTKFGTWRVPSLETRLIQTYCKLTYLAKWYKFLFSFVLSLLFCFCWIWEGVGESSSLRFLKNNWNIEKIGKEILFPQQCFPWYANWETMIENIMILTQCFLVWPELNFNSYSIIKCRMKTFNTSAGKWLLTKLFKSISNVRCRRLLNVGVRCVAFSPLITAQKENVECKWTFALSLWSIKVIFIGCWYCIWPMRLL